MDSVYLARATIGGLIRQGFLNAYWNVLVWRLTPAAFRWRHLIPGLFTIGVVLTALAGLHFPQARFLLAGGLVVYGALAMVAALHIFWRTRWLPSLALPPLFLLYHFCYGCGTVAGLRHLVAPSRNLRADTMPSI
jgi:hypothetical protein